MFGSDQVDDPDALVLLDAMARETRRTILWTAPRAPVRSLLGASARDRVQVCLERSARALWTYARAPVVLHTAGLYASPEPSRRRTVITVWHGDGPKASHPPQVRGTYMVTGVEAFGRRRIAVHGYPSENLLVTGRPRVDDIFAGQRSPVDAGALARLGLDERPIVWWLPTWRQGAGGAATTVDAAVWSSLELSSLGCHAGRFQFVVKPHRLARDQRWPAGWRVLRDRQLHAEGIRWYRLLGSARAIITDYSSVWSDFLATDVPIGFAIGDVGGFAAARGFYETDWMSRLPGPVIEGPDDFAALVCEDWSQEWKERRRATAEQLGANNADGATARLLAALDERGVPWRG